MFIYFHTQTQTRPTSTVFFCNFLYILQGKVFTEEEDAFLLNMMHRYGYGNWEVIRMEIRKVRKVSLNCG